jgi:hypothetical protein
MEKTFVDLYLLGKFESLISTYNNLESKIKKNFIIFRIELVECLRNVSLGGCLGLLWETSRGLEAWGLYPCKKRISRF